MDKLSQSIREKLLSCHLKAIDNIGIEDINTRHMKKNGMTLDIDEQGRFVKIRGKRPVQVFVEGKWRMIDWTDEYHPHIVMSWKTGHFRAY